MGKARASGGSAAGRTGPSNEPTVVAILPRGLPAFDWSALRSLSGGSHFSFLIDGAPLFDAVAPSSTVYAREIARIGTLVPFLGQSLHVIGIGVAAPIALAIARDQQDRVRSLTLIEPLALGLLDPDDGPEEALLSAHMAVVGACAESVLKGQVADAGKRLTRFLGGQFSPCRDPDHRETLLRHLMPAMSGSIAAAQLGRTKSDVGETFVPTALIVGECASPLQKHLALKLTGLLPEASLIRIDGAGFLPLLTHPDTVLSAVDRHIGRARFHAPPAAARPDGVADDKKRARLTSSPENQR